MLFQCSFFRFEERFSHEEEVGMGNILEILEMVVRKRQGGGQRLGSEGSSEC